MLTRGKAPNVSDGVHYQDHEAIADEDGMNDDISSEKGSYSSKDRRSEDRGSFRPNSSLKVKNTPKPDGTPSPVLVSTNFVKM